MYEDKETRRKRRRRRGKKRRRRRKRKSRRKSRRKSKMSIGRGKGVVIRKGMIMYYMSTLPPRTFKLKS